MVDRDDESRPPTVDDLVGLCRSLNDQGAKYVVIGGMAMIQQGFVRATEDIDLLVDASPENVSKLKRALLCLPDAAVKDMGDRDLDEYVVVRISDEIVVDLMKEACGLRYADAAGEVLKVDVEGVPIPFASARLLLKLKRTVREKDRLDSAFLTNLLRQQRG